MSTHSFNPTAAEAEANTRLRNYITRSAGQHRRAIAHGFSEARDQLESRTRHHMALVHSTTAQAHAGDRT